jgi:hypothetical protein
MSLVQFLLTGSSFLIRLSNRCLSTLVAVGHEETVVAAWAMIVPIRWFDRQSFMVFLHDVSVHPAGQAAACGFETHAGSV